MEAEERIRSIKKAIRGDESYQPYAEHKLMETYSIGYNDLMEFPYDRYLECLKIVDLEAKEEKKESERRKRKMDT